MTKAKILIGGLVALLLGVGIGMYFLGAPDLSQKATDFAGAAPGNLLAENYDPYVQYNGGYNSAKSITTSDTLTSATLSVSGASTLTGAISTTGSITETNTGTSTLNLKSTSATKGACIEFHATSTNQILNMTFAASSTPSTAGVIPVIRFGACN